jgi:hypothetical protein
MEYKPLKGEYLFDVAVKLYVDAVIGVKNILNLNPGINLDNDLFGQTLTYNKEIRRKPVFNVAKKVENYYFYAYDFQSVYDVSLQLFGNLTGLSYVLSQGVNVNDRVTIGKEFIASITSDPMTEYYKKNKIIAQTYIVDEVTGDIAGIITETGFNFITEDLSGNQVIIPE